MESSQNGRWPFIQKKAWPGRSGEETSKLWEKIDAARMLEYWGEPSGCFFFRM
jgi:hypothetical protein